MINVLIVNDSIMVQQLLRRILETDPELNVTGIAEDGAQAIRAAKMLDPDVILMDIQMPNVNGVRAVQEIMNAAPKPILIVTATIRSHMLHIYDCLGHGALEVIKTPSPSLLAGGNFNNPVALKKAGEELLKRIHVIASLKGSLKKKNAPNTEKTAAKSAFNHAAPAQLAPTILALGASTGGPNALSQVLRLLPENFSSSVVLVQHIDADFTHGLAEWFDSNCKLKIAPAEEGSRLTVGQGYLASKAKNLVLRSDRTLGYEDAPAGALHVPSIDITFESVAEIYGSRAIGVLLTGMGADGAKGLKAIRDAGGRTIAQDEESSVVYGMPRVAKEIGGAEFVLPLNKIAGKICELLGETCQTPKTKS